MINLKKWASLLVVAVLFCATAVDAQSTKSKRKAKAKPATASKPAAAPQTIAPATPAGEPQAATPPGEIERITVEELKAKIAKNEPVTIIDSRSQGSYDGSNQKIKGAIRIPAGDIESRLKEIPRDKEVVVYCT
jgi:3-mercaptopyruvate sulfurtransferase SseA